MGQDNTGMTTDHLERNLTVADDLNDDKAIEIWKNQYETVDKTTITDYASPTINSTISTIQ